MDEAEPNRASGVSKQSCTGCHVIILAAILAVAAVLRFHALGDENFWLDEIHSMINSAGRRAELAELHHNTILIRTPRLTEMNDDSTLSAAWRTMRHEFHPPLYFVLLQAWRKVWGDSEAAVRALPAAFSLGTIMVLFMCCRALGQPAAGLWAAGLMACAFTDLHMARENRPYSLACFAVSIGFWLLCAMDRGWMYWSRRRKTAACAAYAIAGYAALMTHYLSGLLWLAQLGYIVSRARRPARRAQTLSWCGALAAMVLSWGPAALVQIRGGTEHAWLKAADVYHTSHSLMRAGNLPIRLLVNWEGDNVNPWLALLGAGVVASAVFALWQRRVTSAALFAWVYLLPLVVLTAVDIVAELDLLSHLRYSYLLLPGLLGLLTLAAQLLPRWTGHVVLAGLTLLCMLSTSYPIRPNPRGEAAAELLVGTATPADLVVFEGIGAPAWFSAETTFMHTMYYADQLAAPVLILSQTPSASLMEQMAQYPRILVVSSHAAAPKAALPAGYRYYGHSQVFRNIGRIYFMREPGADFQ